MEGGWFDSEAIEQERLDADILQAQYEEEGNRFARQLRESERLNEAGQAAEAAEACPHGFGYPLDSPAAENEGDPFAGQNGWRCLHCGSRLADSVHAGAKVLVPCEWKS